MPDGGALSYSDKMSSLLLAAVSCFVIGLTNASYNGLASSSADEDLKVQQSQDLPVYVTCQPSGNGESDIYWSMPDGERVEADLENNVYSSHENEQLLLVIQEVNEESKGEYICWEENDGETTERKRFVFRARAAAMPTFRSGYDFVTAYEGDNITMVCEADGDRPMEYSWLDQHDSVIPDSAPNVAIHKTEKGSELHINWVSNETRGVYTCVASNHHGTNSKLFRVTINKRIDSFPPFFNETKQKVHGVESQPLTLWCQAEGMPTPTYTWFDEYGVVLDSNHSRVIDVNQLDYNSSSTFYGNSSRDIRVSRKYGFLIFRALNESDSGNYTCKAENPLGAAFKEYELLVSTSTGGFPPFFKETREDVHGIGGQPLTMKCQAEGNPTPIYTWFNNHGIEMDMNYPGVIDLDKLDYHSSETDDTFNSSRVIFVSKKEGSLSFTALNKSDGGNYVCKAENPFGVAFKYYDVYVNTSVGHFRPFFIMPTEYVQGFVSRSLTLICQANGNPTPTLVWYNKRTNERLDRFHPRVIDLDLPNNTSEIRTKNSSILVSNRRASLTFVRFELSDAGEYACNAHNYLGNASKTYVIYVNERDYIKVFVRNITDSSVTFSILDSSPLPLRSYEAQYKLINERTLYRISWSSYYQKYTVPNLLPGAIYTFQFRALRGGSNWTDPIRVALKPPPPEIILQNVETRKVKIEMFRPSYMFYYSTIDQYIIKYRTISQVGGNTWDYRTCEVTIIIPSCYGSYYEISNLQIRAYYSITIQAVGPAGNSTLSEIKVYVPS